MAMKTFDFYRKIPLDLTETTLQGAIMSICALFFMLILFICELRAFLTPEVYSTVSLDTNRDAKLRINFNITMLSLPCEYATVDVLDVLGTNHVNITKNIIKHHTDARGVKVEFYGRNREQDDLEHEDHHPSLDVAHQDGEHAAPLDSAAFDAYMKDNRDVIVDFYAPWCIWCQRLAPTWEAFAEAAEEELEDLRVVKVDCVTERDLCQHQKIHAFPTIRFFQNGAPLAVDYKTDRSVDALLEYAEATMNADHETLRKYNRHKQEYPGCQLSGFIMVNRVPGNFHIESRSKHHNINGALANVSHAVRSLSFGTQFPTRRKAPRPDQHMEGVAMLEDQVYLVDRLHTAPHHYIKVVSTFLSKEWSTRGDREILQYQMVVSSQNMPYEEGSVPEAKFSYDLSPMCVQIRQRRRAWYDFITSVMAIVGGTFTVVGVLDNILFRVIKQKKI